MAFTDEQLSAYLDGELTADERRQIDEALESDPGLFERLARLKTVDNVLNETLSDIANDPVSDRLIGIIQADRDNAANNIISLERLRSFKAFQTPLAMAAAAAFGLFIGTQFMNTSQTIPQTGLFAGHVASDSTLHDALERTPSQSEYAGITPLLTFQSVDGDVCREVTSKSERALACRSNGSWVVLAVTHEPDTNAPETYATASANASIVFDVLSEQMMDGAALSADAEQDLIDRNWSKHASPPQTD